MPISKYDNVYIVNEGHDIFVGSCCPRGRGVSVSGVVKALKGIRTLYLVPLKV